MLVTIFKNIKETSTPFYRDVDFVLDRIKRGVNVDLIKQIRAEKDKTKRNLLKRDLPAICFSGKFSKRSDDSIDVHSGVICLDFDGYEKKSEMNDDKKKLSEDEHVMAVFISPSGKGLKALIRIPKDIENHKRYFVALEDYFSSKYFDPTSKNISRVCYESYDPKIYINYDSIIWDIVAESSHKTIDRTVDMPTIPVTDKSKVIQMLMSWWNKKYGLVEGERNNNVFILASAFNEYGVDRSLAEHVIGDMAHDGFPSAEIRTILDSAYRNTASFDTKYFRDDTIIDKIKRGVSKGQSDSELKKIVAHLPIEKEVVDGLIGEAKKDPSVKVFWGKSQKGVLHIIPIAFKDFLEQNGFFKYKPPNGDYRFVKVTENLIDNSCEKEIKDFVLSYILEGGDVEVFNFFSKKTVFFKEDFLSMLGTVNIHFVRDTRKASYIYYRNCTLKITKEKIIELDYSDLDGFVWRDHVLDRDFTVSNFKKAVYKKFISNVANSDPSKTLSLESTIGFLLSRYKDPSKCPSVILNDEMISENPEGGTGKGLFVQGIKHIRKVSRVDGKKFDPDNKFGFQSVDPNANIISFDDAKNGFPFERLFSVITEGIDIEMKHMASVSIPFEDAPKIIITTNYAIGGKGNSHDRRKWEVELTQHYSSSYTPVDEFGQRLFDDWDESEWLMFDNYMISNLQLYLSKGLVKAEFTSGNIRKVSKETSHAFIEWIGLVEGSVRSDAVDFNKRLFKDVLYMDFIKDNPDFQPRAKLTITRREFYRWLKSYASHTEGVTMKEGRSAEGRWIIYETDESKTSKSGEIAF